MAIQVLRGSSNHIRRWLLRRRMVWLFNLVWTCLCNYLTYCAITIGNLGLGQSLHQQLARNICSLLIFQCLRHSLKVNGLCGLWFHLYFFFLFSIILLLDSILHGCFQINSSPYILRSLLHPSYVEMLLDVALLQDSVTQLVKVDALDKLIPLHEIDSRLVRCTRHSRQPPICVLSYFI